MTQLHGARSGHIVWTRRRHDRTNDLADSDAILIMGSIMAENHPVGFQWVMEARERGAQDDSRRPAFHPHLRDGRYLGAAAGRHRHYFSGRADPLRAGERASISANTWCTTPTRP